MRSRYFWHFTAQKSKCPRRFWELDPEILHKSLMCSCRTCLMCSCRTFYDFFFCFSVFSPNMWGSLRPKYPPKITKTKNLAKKKTNNKKSVKAGQGHIKHVCKFQGLNLTNGVDIGIWRNLGFSLNQPLCAWEARPQGEKNLERGTLNTCAKFQGLTLSKKKRRGHWHLKEFWVLCLNQPVCAWEARPQGKKTSVKLKPIGPFWGKTAARWLVRQ